MQGARALAFAVALLLFDRNVSAQQAPAEIKTHMDAGDAAAKARDFEKAAAEYKAAFDLSHAAIALEGMANALYEAKKAPEAYEAYDALLTSYSDQIKKKFLAEARHKDLANRTGAIVVRVSEAHATVEIDGKALGASPIPPHRVTIGTHKVRVTKAGFAPFEQSTNVAAAAGVIVDATLAREARTGHLVIREKTGKPMRAVVDGLDVGPTPWEGDVVAGPHEVLVRNSQGASTPQRVELAGGATQTIELEAAAAVAHLEIKTSEPTSIVFLDDKPLAEGSFVGEVAPGEHKLVVTKEGYERFETKLALAAHSSQKLSVILKKPGARGWLGVAEDPNRGIYGGFAVTGFVLPAGTGNDVENRCRDLGAEACDKSLPFGGGLFGYVGYSFDPIGFEAFFGLEYDQTSPTAHFTGTSGTNSNPLATGPARTEEFQFVRGGGLVAVRARANATTDTLRLSAAGGFGIAYKYVGLAERKATSADLRLSDRFAPKGSFYASPGVSLDLSVQWRLAEPTALAFGAMMWLESSSFTDVRAAGQLNRYMGGTDAQGNPTRKPIVTPPYQMTSGAQLFVGPYVGMQFGP